MNLTESIVEEAALTWFGEQPRCARTLTPALSHEERERAGHGPQMAPGEPAAERSVDSRRQSFGEVVLVGRLREALRRLNPTLPEEAREEALRKVLRVAKPSLVQTNRAFHRLLRGELSVADSVNLIQTAN